MYQTTQKFHKSCNVTQNKQETCTPFNEISPTMAEDVYKFAQVIEADLL